MSDNNSAAAAHRSEGAYTDEELKDGTRTAEHAGNHDEDEGKYTDSDVPEPGEHSSKG